MRAIACIDGKCPGGRPIGGHLRKPCKRKAKKKESGSGNYIDYEFYFMSSSYGLDIEGEVIKSGVGSG